MAEKILRLVRTPHQGVRTYWEGRVTDMAERTRRSVRQSGIESEELLLDALEARQATDEEVVVALDAADASSHYHFEVLPSWWRLEGLRALRARINFDAHQDWWLTIAAAIDGDVDANDAVEAIAEAIERE